ncbi:hypothetical protein AURDEDRAFT_167964 [Auricularia subglabra TFB-10046 SS5]|nr:hypothetical protein AURDEDRAFT_167964 [Auricularia subglabra TFB-10046 SS5]
MDTAFEQFAVALRAARVTTSTTISAAALLAYDIALTLTLEINHIWGFQWSLPKAMYLFCRYYALVHLLFIAAVDSSTNPSEMVRMHVRRGFDKQRLIGVQTCAAYIRIAGFGPQVLALVTDAVLIMRVRSMYQNSKKVTLVLVVLFLAQLIIEAVVVGIVTTDPIIPTPPFLRVPLGCLYQNPFPRFTLAVWIPALSFATLLFGMTLYKLWEFQKADVRASDLLVLFAQDGAMFFAMIFCLLLLGTLSTGLAPADLQDVGVPWLVAVYGIVTSRLILNLREYNTTSSMITQPTSLQLSSFEMRVRSTNGRVTTESYEVATLG